MTAGKKMKSAFSHHSWRLSDKALLSTCQPSKHSGEHKGFSRLILNSDASDVHCRCRDEKEVLCFAFSGFSLSFSLPFIYLFILYVLPVGEHRSISKLFSVQHSNQSIYGWLSGVCRMLMRLWCMYRKMKHTVAPAHTHTCTHAHSHTHAHTHTHIHTWTCCCIFLCIVFTRACKYSLCQLS